MDESNKQLLINIFGENESSKNHKTFDIMNVQFNIHYYLENDITFNNFLYNVNKYLKKDGFILITTLDGNLVHKSFNNDGKFGVEHLSKDGNKSILYDINRLYPADTKNLKQTGLAINVLMKWITQDDYYKEYLVEPEFLIESMNKIGLSLIETDTFKSLFDIYEDYLTKSIENESIPKTKKVLKDVSKFYDENLINFHSYSFLNRYYIFQKN
jgi:SAM-dependent methyltransferase